MPNIAILLRDEIQRLARKEVKVAHQALKKENVDLRKNVSDLRKRLDRLERDNRRLMKATGEAARPGAKLKDEDVENIRISAKGVRSMRQKMRLSQADFARLAGVSTQSVAKWESQEGVLRLRSRAKKALADLRGVGAREAQKRLEALAGAAAPAAEA